MHLKIVNYFILSRRKKNQNSLLTRKSYNIVVLLEKFILKNLMRGD
jgi:hypothetical protein